MKFLLIHGAEISMDKEDFYGFRPIEWLGTPIESYLSQLTGVNPVIIEQFKNSFRGPAEIINGHIAQDVISKKFPAIAKDEEFVKRIVFLFRNAYLKSRQIIYYD